MEPSASSFMCERFTDRGIVLESTLPLAPPQQPPGLERKRLTRTPPLPHVPVHSIMSRPFSSRASGLVIAMAFGFALVVFLGYRVAAPARHRQRVEAMLPHYLAMLQAHRDQLVRAIETYRAQLGFYPPNAATQKLDWATLNPLYYELAGTRWHPDERWFGLPTTKQPLSLETLQKSFGLTSFSNTTQFPTWPTNFLQQAPVSFREENGVLLLVSVVPAEIPDDLADDFVLTPWRYATAPAEHNPGRFDLWMELRANGQSYHISNW